MANNTAKQLEREFQAIQDKAIQAARREAEELADIIRRNTPVDTGALRDSVEVVNTPDGARVTVGGSLEYADIVETKEPFVAPAVAGFRSSFESAVSKAV